MTLTWADIDARWPDAGVMWDRDVAPTLDWEPRFVERRSVWEAYDSVLFADDSSCWHVAGMSRMHGSPCRCLVWDGAEWIDRVEAMRRKYERDVAKLAASRVDPRRWWNLAERDRIETGTGRIFIAGGQFNATGFVASRRDRWPVLRSVLGANRPL